MNKCLDFFLQNIFFIIFLLFFQSLIFAAPLKFVPQELKQPDGQTINCFASGDNFSELLANSKVITKSDILKTVTLVTTSFEDTREFPDTIWCDGNHYPIQTLIKLYSEVILAINEDRDITFELPLGISPSIDFYVNLDLDSIVYSTPLSKLEYLTFCGAINKELSNISVLPNAFNYKNAQIRSVEVLYLLASILRSYDFFQKLPEVAEIMVTPKGLVPWSLSSTQRKFTSMNNGWLGWYNQTNNYYNVGKYETFKIAKNIIGYEADPYNAGNLIYDAIFSRWLEGGYLIWVKPFAEPDYAYTQWRFNLSNSASQFDKMNMLIRSIGIPCTENRMYDDISKSWINIDVHKPFGVAPYGFNENNITSDFKEPLKRNSVLIQRIREQIAKNNNQDINNKSIWINASDISQFGVDFILNKCKSSGINRIIITVKSGSGHFFYPTKYNRKGYIDYPKFGNQRFLNDAISDLTSKAPNYGIKIYPALSILNDYFMWMASLREIGRDNINNWMQYIIGSTDWGDPDNFIGISPCVSAFKDSTMKYIKEAANLPGISGIVLSSLYCNTANYKYPHDGNPNCSCYSNDSLWQSKLLLNYAADLINGIKNENSNLKVILSSYPLEFSYYPSFGGMLDQDIMKNLADEYILCVGYIQWLNTFENYAMPVVTLYPFNLENYVKKLSFGAQKPITVSISIKDEWIYPPEFYSGVAKGLISAGANNICFHNMNSLEGEFGPAFDSFQYSIIGSMDFTKSVPNSVGNISGNVSYYSQTPKPLKNIKVSIKNISTGELNTTVSDSSGNYIFATIAAGDYIIKAEKSGEWSGVNATDALWVMKYCVGSYLFSPIQMHSADVNCDSRINATDALLIARRSVGSINSFAAGDWVFDSLSIALANDVAINLNGLCVGDVNGSSAIILSKDQLIVSTNSEEIIFPDSNIELEIPVRINKKAELGAYTIFIHYPGDLIEIKNINSKNDNFSYCLENNTIKAVWYGMVPLILSANDPLFSIKIKNIETGSKRKIIFSIDPATEFADTSGLPFKGLIPVFSNRHSSLPVDYSLSQNYPNPFNPITTIKYSLPVNSKVKISLFNIIGQQIKLLKDEIQDAGYKELIFNCRDLSSGVYFYSLYAEAIDGSKNYKEVKKLMLLK